MAEPVVLSVGKHDNVLIAIRPLSPGIEVEIAPDRRLVVLDSIPFGHKLAVTAIPTGEAVVKYDETIGVASADIRAGAHVHVHNVVSSRLPGVAGAGRCDQVAR